MFRRIFTLSNLSVLALLGAFLVPQPAAAQQGWPMNGGNWSTGGSSGGSSSYSPSYGGSYSATPSYDYAAPTYYATPNASVTRPGVNYQSLYYTPQAENDATVRNGSVLLNVSAPANAEIWFNGAKTAQSGSQRQFVSPPLTAGHDYYYEVKVKWAKNGKEVVQTRQVSVHAGDVINVAFNAATAK